MIEIPERAFTPMEEALVWDQDASPHLSSMVSATVLHGAPMSESAGPSRGTFAADPWTVAISERESRAAEIKVGDRFTTVHGVTLSVQQIARDRDGWLFSCTANARAPRQ